MDMSHQLNVKADNGNEVLFVCSDESCGKRLIVKRTGGLVILDHGDFAASHTGGSASLAISVGVGQPA
jgi:hypothetical protein